MSRLLSMRARRYLPMDDDPAHLALDGHAASVRVVMLLLQHAAQILGLDQDLVIARVPHALVELGRAVGVRVRWLRGALHDGVVMDARIDEDATRAFALVEPVYS